MKPSINFEDYYCDNNDFILPNPHNLKQDFYHNNNESKTAKFYKKRDKDEHLLKHVTFFYVSLYSMKERLLIICLLSFIATITVAQQPHIIVPDSSLITTERDSLDIIRRQARMEETNKGSTLPSADSTKIYPRFTVWKIEERTGERYSAIPDTILYNYQQTTLVDGQSVAMGNLGNLGSPAFSKLFFDRGEGSQFVFYDAYYLYNKNPDNQLFFNTRVPYSKINYQRAGGNLDKEERLETRFAMNFNRHLNIGFDLDFIKANGFYNSQTVKQNNYSVYGNYLSDRVEAHAYASQTSMTNFENGGIADPTFITNPESIEQNFSSRDIPTRYVNTWNRMKTTQLYLSARYNLGYNKQGADEKVKEFVPIASVILTSRYKQQERRFLSYDTTRVTLPNNNVVYAIDTLYQNNYYKSAVDGSTSFNSLKNTLFIKIKEEIKSTLCILK